jgi:hypothetical protein
VSTLGTSPFGQPVLPVWQRDRSAQQVFLLGVYAGTVHARWIGSDNRTRIAAAAVASEPEIFWSGDNTDDIVGQVTVPPGTGRLEDARLNLNGVSFANYRLEIQDFAWSKDQSSVKWRLSLAVVVRMQFIWDISVTN